MHYIRSAVLLPNWFNRYGYDEQITTGKAQPGLTPTLTSVLSKNASTTLGARYKFQWGANEAGFTTPRNQPLLASKSQPQQTGKGVTATKAWYSELTSGKALRGSSATPDTLKSAPTLTTELRQATTTAQVQLLSRHNSHQTGVTEAKVFTETTLTHRNTITISKKDSGLSSLSTTRLSPMINDFFSTVSPGPGHHDNSLTSLDTL